RFTNSSHLPASEGSKFVKPVRLPPGRAKRWTTPAVKPGGNLTSVAPLGTETNRKRLQLLHELLPDGGTIAALVKPTFPGRDIQARELQAAASTLGRQLHILHASSRRDIDTAFTNLVRLQASGLVIGSDPFFNSWSEQLAVLALRHAVPAIYEFR